MFNGTPKIKLTMFSRCTKLCCDLLKDAMPVSFRSSLFTSYILTIFKQSNLLSNYEKLSNIVIYAYKNITENMNLLKMCGLQIRLCLFTFRPITSKQLNSLTTNPTLSWPGGAEVTHPHFKKFLKTWSLTHQNA